MPIATSAAKNQVVLNVPRFSFMVMREHFLPIYDALLVGLDFPGQRGAAILQSSDSVLAGFEAEVHGHIPSKRQNQSNCATAATAKPTPPESNRSDWFSLMLRDVEMSGPSAIT